MSEDIFLSLFPTGQAVKALALNDGEGGQALLEKIDRTAKAGNIEWDKVDKLKTDVASKMAGVEPKQPHKKKTSDATSDGWPNGYEASDGWLYYIVTRGDKAHAVKMCTLFEVIGHTVDETGQASFGLLIRFADKRGGDREFTILDSEARSDTGGVIARLSDAGFWIDNTTEAKAKFLTLLGRLTTDRFVTVASRGGWHGGTFVTPYGRAIGADLTVRLTEPMKLTGSVDRLGSLEEWRNQAANLMIMLDAHGTVVLCGAFAGVIVDLLKHDTCGIAITGESSRGKSIAQKFAATVWSDPAPRKGLWVAARGTANGLEAVAAQASGTTLQIDELKGMKAEQIGEIIMMLSGGVSKIRQDGDQGLQRALRWNTYFTMSAEESIRELIEGSRGSYVTGYGVRAVEIDTTDASLFECPEWVDRLLKSRIGEHWGHAGPAFVSYLITAGYVEQPERLERRLADAVTWILDGATGGGAKGRAAGVLAYALVCGEIAQEAGIVPSEGNIENQNDSFLRQAFRKVWQSSWGSEEGTPENSPETAFKRLQGRVAAEWHLHTWDELQAVAADVEHRPGADEPRLAKWFYIGPGYRMDISKDVTVDYVAVTKEAFRQLVAGYGVKERAILQWAKQAGYLLPRDKHLTHLHLPKHGPVDHYRFRVGALGPAE
jgi:hypothetical protein